MKRSKVSASRWVLCLALLALLPVGCSSVKKTAPPAVSALDASEAKAELAVEKTSEDERFASKIQREMNELFFHGKRVNPGGLDAFSDERLEELEEQMKESKESAIQYFLENRKYFERTEDSGGGFFIVANGRRLVPYLKTRAGRVKLFQMDLFRVREMTRHPCFSALEDCGEDASDGEENTTLLEEWKRKYPEKEFRSDREKVLRFYLEALGAYEKKFRKKLKPAIEVKDQRKIKSGKEALLYIGGHRGRVSALLGE